MNFGKKSFDDLFQSNFENFFKQNNDPVITMMAYIVTLFIFLCLTYTMFLIRCFFAFNIKKILYSILLLPLIIFVNIPMRDFSMALITFLLLDTSISLVMCISLGIHFHYSILLLLYSIYSEKPYIYHSINTGFFLLVFTCCMIYIPNEKNCTLFLVYKIICCVISTALSVLSLFVSMQFIKFVYIKKSITIENNISNIASDTSYYHDE